MNLRELIVNNNNEVAKVAAKQAMFDVLACLSQRLSARFEDAPIHEGDDEIQYWGNRTYEWFQVGRTKFNILRTDYAVSASTCHAIRDQAFNWMNEFFESLEQFLVERKEKDKTGDEKLRDFMIGNTLKRAKERRKNNGNE